MQSVIYTEKIGEVASRVDRAVIDYIFDGQIQTFESFETFDVIAFDWYDPGDLSAKPAKVMLYLDEDDIFCLCGDETAHRRASRIFDAAESNERVLYRFFCRLIRDDAGIIAGLEDDIAELEDAVLTDPQGVYTDDIIAMRKQLLRLRKYYEQLVTIFEELHENENNLLSVGALREISILRARASRLLGSVVHLSEYVTQVREAYQAQIDIAQNDLMKFFTVITSLFLPLTLIVGWYGMNFEMPELRWQYGYGFVILLCLALGAALFIYFKRKKYF